MQLQISRCTINRSDVQPNITSMFFLSNILPFVVHMMSRAELSSLDFSLHIENIRGADIIAQTKIEIPPDWPLDYHWVGHGFKVHIPAGAISEERGPVTLCIQASLSGDYQLPDDGVLVSGVYWISLHPPVEKFHKNITVTIQHYASYNDLTLSFVTANSTQMTLPYTFKAVSGGSFSQPRYGTLQVDYFSAMAISGERRSSYAFCTYYIPKALNVYHVHITVTPELEEWLYVSLDVGVSSYNTIIFEIV